MQYPHLVISSLGSWNFDQLHCLQTILDPACSSSSTRNNKPQMISLAWAIKSMCDFEILYGTRVVCVASCYMTSVRLRTSAVPLQTDVVDWRELNWQKPKDQGNCSIAPHTSVRSIYMYQSSPLDIKWLPRYHIMSAHIHCWAKQCWAVSANATLVTPIYPFHALWCSHVQIQAWWNISLYIHIIAPVTKYRN